MCWCLELSHKLRDACLLHVVDSWTDKGYVTEVQTVISLDALDALQAHGQADLHVCQTEVLELGAFPLDLDFLIGHHGRHFEKFFIFH